MTKFTFERIRLEYLNFKYEFNNEGAYNMNIFGIRSKNRIAGQYDDYIGLMYFDEAGKKVLKLYPATTDPGSYYLQNPLHSKGTLIMVQGQYIDAFTIGLHGRSSLSPYKALEQCGNINYIRDNNLDNIINLDLIKDKANIIKGNFKTNIHRSKKSVVNNIIGKFSAGCQVFQSSTDFDEFISLCELHVKKGNNKLFNYTLFNSL